RPTLARTPLILRLLKSSEPVSAPIGQSSPRSQRSGSALQLSGLDQALANELARCNSARAGKEAAAGMGHELVEHVELSQLAENLDKAGAGIALVTHEKKPGVIRDTLAPRRPALDSEIGAVIVRVGTPQNLHAIIAHRSCETDMGAFGNNR